MVEPGDVLNDGELELGSGAPHAVGDQFGLEAVDEAFGERVVIAVADGPDRREHGVVVEDLLVVVASVTQAQPVHATAAVFSSSEVILYQVSQMVSHRRAERTPKGVVPRDAVQGEQRF